MKKTLSNITKLQRWGNSYVIIVTDEAKLLRLQAGDLVAFTIRKETPVIQEDKE